MPTLITPRNADELEEMLHDSTQRTNILKDPGSLKDFIVDYAKNQAETDPGISQQIRDESQRLFAEMLRGDQVENINRLNLAADSDPVGRSSRHNPKAPGAALDKKFANWGDYLANIWTKNNTAEAMAAKSDIQQLQNSFGSTVPADGGFLIPERLRADLLRVALESSLIRPRARVVPMDSLTVPFPTIDSVTNASTVYGGLVGYWTEEGGALTDSAPTFGRVVLTAKKLTIYAEIPNELFQDSIISLQAFMDDAYPEALAWFEDQAFINGTGVGEPLGVLNAGAAVSVTKETGQAASTIVWENIVKAYSRMLPASINRAVWIANINAFPELATMALSVGTGGSAIWLANGADGPPMTILGRPVIFTEKVSTLGTAGDINFVDLGYYLIGDRQAIQAETSTEYKFGNDKTAMRVIERVDGQPWIKSAITPATGSSTLSPFVKVATRA